MGKPLVFLVPGFFGFTSVGAVSYFEQVEQTLGEALKQRGVDARIVRCATRPTASIRRRAAQLRAEVLRRGGLRADALHFVGHSTGGLDVRLMLTPGPQQARDAPSKQLARLTRTAISLATPHHGTPLANHFTTLHGQALLLVLSALATSGQGRSVIVAAAKAIALAARADDWLGRAPGPLDRIASGLLGTLRRDRDDPLWQYLDQIRQDQGAVLQLTPEGIDLFDATVADHPDIDYGCVVAGVPAPREDLNLGDMLNPEFVALRAVFRLLHGLTARPHPHYPYPAPTAAARRMLAQGLGAPATSASNDGIVPVLSQLHGRLLHVARADHLDVIGHYTLAGGGTADWLPSGAGFTPQAFDATWDAVATAIAAAGR